MIRVTRNDDIAFNVNEVRGKGDRYKITFYTVNNAVNIQKTDQDVTDGIITLNGSELMTIGEGVMNFRVDNIAPNAGYNDGVFNSSFTRTTKYYIVSGVIIPDGEDTETVIDLVSELQNTVSSEITRSTNKDNAHDAALANIYTKAEIDDMLDDIDVVLPDNIVTDDNYTHTDNNFTTTEKTKLAGIANGAEVNVQSDWNVTNTSSDAFIKNKPTNVSAFTNDAGYIATETDPTVPAWAKATNKPTYTASEVGALSSSTVIPSKTSDLTNDSNFVVDANYTHTDNNFTTTEKTKLSGLSNYDDTALSNRVTANTTAIANTYTKTEIDSKFTDVRANTVGVFDGYDAYITLESHYNETGDYNELQITDGYSGSNVVIPFTGGFMSAAGFTKNTITINATTTGDTFELMACAFNSLTVRSNNKNITLTLGNNGSNLHTGFYYLYITNGNALKLASLTFPSTLEWENGDVPQLSEFSNGTTAWLIYIINNCAMVKRFK